MIRFRRTGWDSPHSMQTATDRPARPVWARVLRWLLPVGALLVALGIAGGFFAPAVWGAVDILYFNAVSSSSAVLLEWSTAGEYNVAGFEVQCKLANEPAAAYHRIAFLNSKGGPGQEVAYDYLVTQLSPGTAYCFRLKEITTDDEPGETRELCGYGLSMTPTPALPITPTAPLTPTVVLFPTATPWPGQPTATPFPGQPTPTPTIFFQQQQSPLPTIDPNQQFLPTIDPLALTATAFYVLNQPSATPTIDFFATATPFPTPLGADPNAMAAAGLDPNFNPELAAAQQFPAQQVTPVTDPAFQPQSPLAQPAVDPNLPSGDAAGAGMGTGPFDPATIPPGEPGAVATPTPTSLYVVVTAQPTEVVQAAPLVVTPWPTATPAAGLQLAGLMQPTAQNLTVMLLCFIFLSASGLGALGLLTSILYMRSRSRREEESLRLRAQRRL